MPTPTGLPKVGEVWELDIKIPDQPHHPHRVVILARSGGDRWSCTVYRTNGHRDLWVNCAYWVRMGWFKYIGPAGPKTKKKLGLL